ncbi:MAG: hypothetical protein JJ944_07815 [Altererythrobacter sp.]|nr:hypothetical protein [Altererythrobacter sp.]
MIDFAATLRDKILEGKPSAMSLSQIRMHQKRGRISLDINALYEIPNALPPRLLTPAFNSQIICLNFFPSGTKPEYTRYSVVSGLPPANWKGDYDEKISPWSGS